MTAFAPASQSQDRVLAELVEEVTNRLQAGEAVDVEAYASQHPEYAEQLRQLVPALQALAAWSSCGGQRLSEVPDSPTGTLGDYRIVREVGRGGMGVVYEAEQISLGRRVALKVLPFAATMDPRQLQRFHNEARAAASLHHEHIVPVYAVGCERGVHYYAMQFIEGRTLAEVIAKHQPPEPRPSGNGDTTPIAAAPTEGSTRDQASYRHVAELGIQAAEALEHAHSLGIVHRDVKPANLMIDGRGKLWVADFGLARTMNDAGLTMSGDLVGTLRYMSPEQALAKHDLVDHRADIYALGATLYELVTLKPAVGGKDREEVLRRIAFEEPMPPRSADPTIPAELETVLLKALAKEPGWRYGTAAELAEDLGRYLAGEPIKARRVSQAERLWLWGRRNRLVAGLTAATMLLLVLAVVGLSVANFLITQEKGKTQREKEQTDAALQLARERETELRRHLYVADMRLALQPQKDLTYQSVLELLDRQIPKGDQEDLRGFEWDYLWRLCKGQRRVLQCQSRDVVYATFNNAGDQLATTSEEGPIKLWDPATGKLLDTLRGHSASVNWVSYSPDGALLASASDDKTVKIWDIRSRRERMTLKGHSKCLVAAVFSPDGKTLASGGDDGVIKLWDPASGQLLKTLPRQPGRIEALAFTPDGKTLASASNDSSASLILWDAATGKQRSAPISVPGGGLNAVAFWPDGRHVAGGGNDGGIRAWNVMTGESIRFVNDGHPGGVQSLAFSPDGKCMASGGNDRIVKVWGVEIPGHCIRSVMSGHMSRVWCVRYSPDGRTLVTTSRDGTVRLWEVDQPQDISHLFYGRSTRSPIVYSHDGTMLAINLKPCDRQNRVELWDPNTMQWKHDLFDCEPIRELAFTRDNSVLAATHADHTITLWDVSRRQVRSRFKPPVIGIEGLALSPDARFAVSSREDGRFEQWDLVTGQLIRKLFQSYSKGFSRISPDGKTFALGAAQAGFVEIWDMASGELRSRAPAHEGAVKCLAFTRDGTTLAFGSYSTIALWDVKSGQLLWSAKGHDGFIAACLFSLDGKTLVTGDSTGVLRLWNVASGQEMLVKREYGLSVVELAFSPDGRTLVTSGMSDKDYGFSRAWWAAPSLKRP